MSSGSSVSRVLNLPSRQVGALLADCLLEGERTYVTQFSPDWSTVTVSGNREGVATGVSAIGALIVQILHDIQTSPTYLHCSSIPLLCSGRGEDDVSSVEDLYHVQITFTEGDLTIQDFSKTVQLQNQGGGNEAPRYLMKDLRNILVTGRVTTDATPESASDFTPFPSSNHSLVSAPTWSYQQPNGLLSQLSTNDSQAMENMLQFGGSTLTLQGTRCFVDFHTMTLIGDTGHTAELQRVPPITDIPEYRVLMKVKGIASANGEALANLRTRLGRGFTTQHVPYPGAGPGGEDSWRWQLIRNFCRQYCIEFHYSLTNGQYGVTVKGAEGYVEKIPQLIRDFMPTILLQLHQAAAPSVLQTLSTVQHTIRSVSPQPTQAAAVPQVPPTPPSIPTILQHSLQSTTPPLWQPQLRSVPCVFNQVTPNSPEWNEVVGYMRVTMATVQVVKIERVQNRPVWERYCLEGRQMSERNQGNTGERYLFHGTRKTDPYTVARSDGGIDFRYSTRDRTLMWGTGAYFAVNASYSDNYSYRLGPPSPQRQMMLVSVFTGRSCHYGTNKQPNLTRPPEYSPGQLYDTVYGESANSGIYVVYDHFKSCPAYIITYIGDWSCF